MLGLDPRIAKYTWTAALVLLLFFLVYVIAETLFIFVVALLLAYFLWPLVSFLDQRLPGRSKLPSVAIVYLALLGVLVFVGIEVGSRIAVQANALSARIPELLARLEQLTVPGAKQTLWMKVLTGIQQQLAAHSQDIIRAVSTAILDIVSHAKIALFVVLVPILSFFFLKDGQVLISSLLDTVAEGAVREKFKNITNDLHLLLAQYMRALVLLGLAAAIVYASFFSLIGLPYALLMGAIAFPCEFIPLVGPLTSSVIILLVAGLSGFGHLFWILLFLAAFRVFQDYVLSPHLLSSGTELHPLLVIFGVLAGGQVGGIPGAFLSVPILATLRILYRQLYKTSRQAPVASRQ